LELFPVERQRERDEFYENEVHRKRSSLQSQIPFCAAIFSLKWNAMSVRFNQFPLIERLSLSPSTRDTHSNLILIALFFGTAELVYPRVEGRGSRAHTKKLPLVNNSRSLALFFREFWLNFLRQTRTSIALLNQLPERGNEKVAEEYKTFYYLHSAV
jgi:hypothetical protein